MLNRFANLVCLLFLATTPAGADVVTVAVASNFRAAAEDIAKRFESDSGHRVLLSAASTGTLYAQISNGAPFDLLLAADAERPALLAKSGLGVAESRFTYAIGGLVLWSRDLRDCEAGLHARQAGFIAVANPDTAPYGRAARDYLLAVGLWNSLTPRLVVAENIAQVLHFAASGNASLGFIASAQLQDERLAPGSCAWEVPTTLHAPIEQQAILLRRAADKPAALALLRYLQSDEIKTLILDRGYRLAQ